MTAPCDRIQGDTAHCLPLTQFVVQGFIFRIGAFIPIHIDDMLGFLGWVVAHRHIDFALLRRRSPDQRLVFFARNTLDKLFADMALRLAMARKNNNPWGVHIKSVNKFDVGVGFQQARLQAYFEFFTIHR